MVDICCVCLVDVSSGTHEKKRLKLHGGKGQETLQRYSNFVTGKSANGPGIAISITSCRYVSDKL